MRFQIGYEKCEKTLIIEIFLQRKYKMSELLK